ncbi:MAG TPA: hypothetical protein DIT25_01820 [Candidatus Moranbacteria bacterium]|nr:hypothetical protein [Candidatus Moranbacteria bacterium]
MAGLIASALANHSYAGGFGIIKGWFLFPLAFAVLAKNIVPEEKKENFFLALYLSALAVSAAGLAHYFLGQVTFDGRVQGIFNSPNYLAMYLAPALIIGLSFFNSGKFRKYLFIYVLSYGLILAVFYLTYSYAAWAALACVSIFIIFFRSNSRIKFKKIIIVSALALLILLSQWSNPKFRDLVSIQERSSLESRIMVWRAAQKIIADNWFLGTGPGNFQEKYLEYQKHFPPYLEWAVPHPHSLWLSFWLSSGMLGLAGFAGLVIVWIRKIAPKALTQNNSCISRPASRHLCLKNSSQDLDILRNFLNKSDANPNTDCTNYFMTVPKEKNAIWYASVGIMAYILLHGTVDTTYFKNDLAVIFWINFFMRL